MQSRFRYRHKTCNIHKMLNMFVSSVSFVAINCLADDADRFRVFGVFRS